MEVDAPKPLNDGKAKGAKEKGKKAEEKEEELSEEDQQLKDRLEMLAQRLCEKDQSLYKPSIAAMSQLIRESTTSMTSVPKPLKFLTAHFDALVAAYETWSDDADCRAMADVLSCLAITYVHDTETLKTPNPLLALKYRFLADEGLVSSWGHEYVRHLTMEIVQKFEEDRTQRDALLKLTAEIIPYCLTHNAESEASDLALELEALDLLEQHIDSNTYERVCRYLVSCVRFVGEPENTSIVNTVISIYTKFDRYTDAMALGLQVNDMKRVLKTFLGCKCQKTQKQLALMLGQVQKYFDLEEEMPDADEDYVELLTEMISNRRLHDFYMELARDLDVVEPKAPEDVYKTHLENTPRGTYTSNMESQRANLADTFVNAFVNAGFGTDKLLTNDDAKDNTWVLSKNEEYGSMSAAASLGMLYLWDVAPGLAEIDRYLETGNKYATAGAMLACGLVGSGVRLEVDPAKGLLSDRVMNKDMSQRVGAIMGLGCAYAGTERVDIAELLIPALGDDASSIHVVGVCAVSLGLIFVGSGDEDIINSLLTVMIERQSHLLESPGAGRFVALALGLVLLGKQEQASNILESLTEDSEIEESIGKVARVMVEVCAHAGTGNVLKVQEMLHICTEQYDNENSEKFVFQSVAVIGIALVAMGEEIGAEMALRTFTHLIQFGDLSIKRAVPLALAVVSASNPKLEVLDTLNKLSHDADAVVAQNAILSLGFIGAGTNNARIAEVLRQLVAYWRKEANHVFCVRIAQGLLHMGKGTLTISPFVGDRQINQVALGGLLVVLISCLDIKNTILGKAHYLLYFLAVSMRPRFLMTVNEDLESVAVSVRVGQAVDVVGQAGRPKTITGFQTHTTPVLLAQGERAEFATDDYKPVASLLEGVVVVSKQKGDSGKEDDGKKK